MNKVEYTTICNKNLAKDRKISSQELLEERETRFATDLIRFEFSIYPGKDRWGEDKPSDLDYMEAVHKAITTGSFSLLKRLFPDYYFYGLTIPEPIARLCHEYSFETIKKLIAFYLAFDKCCEKEELYDFNDDIEDEDEKFYTIRVDHEPYLIATQVDPRIIDLFEPMHDRIKEIMRKNDKLPVRGYETASTVYLDIRNETMERFCGVKNTDLLDELFETLTYIRKEVELQRPTAKSFSDIDTTPWYKRNSIGRNDEFDIAFELFYIEKARKYYGTVHDQYLNDSKMYQYEVSRSTVCCYVEPFIEYWKANCFQLIDDHFVSKGSGKIYFVRGSKGAVKIGYTSGRVESRLKSLQTGSPDKLELLGVVDGGRELEKLLHKRYAEKRLEGEWFKLGERDIKRELTAGKRG